jgi:hypothetical protein
MTTSIEITEDIAKQWQDFMNNYSMFSKMLEMGVFEKDNIQVTLFFDKFSSLRAIDKTKRVIVNDKNKVKLANIFESSIM